MRVGSAISHHQQWYRCDGIYGDGPEFHCDYYNSFVIQPMLVDIAQTLGHFYTESDGVEIVGDKLKRTIIFSSQPYSAIR